MWSQLRSLVKTPWLRSDTGLFFPHDTAMGRCILYMCVISMMSVSMDDNSVKWSIMKWYFYTIMYYCVVNTKWRIDETKFVKETRSRAASHYTISVVRRIRLDAICHDGSSQVIVANDWHRDPCDAPSHTTRLIFHNCVQSHNLPRCLRYFWTCSKCYDGLRYPPIIRIAADRIAEGLTLHDVLSVTASWGAIAGRR